MASTVVGKAPAAREAGLARLRTALTGKGVGALAYDPSGPPRQVLWDTKVTGFGCRVTPSGGKQYVLAYRFNGRPRLMSLGSVRHFQNVSDARDRAAMYLHQLRDEGKDPMARRERLSSSGTIKELWAQYEQEHVARQSAHSRRAIKSIARKHLLTLEHLKPQQLQRGDLVRLHDRVTATSGPVIANRTIQRFRAFVSWVSERDPAVFDRNFRDEIRSIRLHQELPRTHHLGIEQMRALAAALEVEPSPWVRAFVALLMVTGCRQGELRRLEWRQVDMVRAVAIIGRTKNGTDQYIQLPPIAVEILRGLPRISDSPWVFPGRPPAEYMAAPIAAYKRALARARLPSKTTFHDLRRSFGTALARQGASAQLVARALNNTSDVAARIYVQLAMDDVRRLADSHALAVLPGSPEKHSGSDHG